MKIMVTGASGFIGSNICLRFNELNLSYFSIDKISPTCDGIKNFHLCDMKDFDSLAKIIQLEQPTHIIHLAARTDLHGSTLEDYDDNIDAVYNLCRVINGLDYKCKALFASSMLVCKVGHIPSHYSDYSATTLYGQSKVIGEKIVRKELKQDAAIIFRPTSIWGPGFKEPYKNFFDMVLKRSFFRIKDNFAYKTYGYIENSCNQIISLIYTDFDSNLLYYIGDEEPINSNSWSVEISESANIGKCIEFPMFLFTIASKLGDILLRFNIKFPLTSFRLKNMTTNNVCDVNLSCSRNKFDVVSRKVAVEKTVVWMKNEK
ncbi:NAD-dependent epimerase/dehydratase family protein [Vibrio harveyi]